MTAFDTNLTSFDKTKHNHLKFSDFNKSGANMKIHARGCGTLISHTHWNPDGGLNATVHVATPPVAANSRGQRLQISFAALRSSSLHRSDRQFFFWIYPHASAKQCQRSNHGTVLFILSWSYLPKMWHVWKNFPPGTFQSREEDLEGNPGPSCSNKIGGGEGNPEFNVRFGSTPFEMALYDINGRGNKIQMIHGEMT